MAQPVRHLPRGQETLDGVAFTLVLPPDLQTAAAAVTIYPIVDPDRRTPTDRIMKGEKAHHIRRFYPPQGSSLLEGHLGALPTAWGKVALGRCEGLWRG